MSSYRIVRGHIVTTDQVIDDGAVVFSDQIIAVGQASEVLSAEQLADHPPTDRYILPGLVDVHCHGGGGESFPNAQTQEAAQVAINEHRRHGTTTLVASAVTASAEDLRSRAELLTQLCKAGELAGIHFEGPFVSHERCGAQDPTYIVDPDPELTRELIEMCQGYCLTMTVAPEKPRAYGEGSVAEVLIEGNALPSWGHTDSGPEPVREALAYSRQKLASCANPRSSHVTATHLFNGMRTIHHRDPGPVPEFLADAANDGVVVELIADGVHVSTDMVRAVYEALGRDRIVFVTDAMAAAGMPDGSYQLGPQAVTVSGGVARLTHGNSIAGGTSHLLDQVRGLVTEERVGIVDAVYMASVQGAKILGRSDIGSLAEGNKADILVTDLELKPIEVFRAGEIVETN
ncbi:MAG: amidohydrolase family protein [Actinomycetaceae bacterium]|nr:amidohydrolase family protein [Actinomycetaceae bacterium]